MAASLDELIGSGLVTEVRPKLELTQTGETVAVFQQQLDNIPVSDSDWRLKEENDTASRGSFLELWYQDGGFSFLELSRPLRAVRTGNRAAIAVSAADAVNGFEEYIKKFPGTTVYDIRDISLVYLSPQEDDGILLPVWQISYDTYEPGATQVTVKANLNDYCCLVDAVSGELIRTH